MCSPGKDPGRRGAGGTVAGRAERTLPLRTCGNLTRFDVTVTRRSRAFHHYSLGGELSVEDEMVLAETVEEVSCRWCGSGRAVEVLVEPLGAAPPGTEG